VINLEPIPKKIQQRMFQKMKALRNHNTSGPNTSNNSDELTFDDMATRTTYIKMVSNQNNPVTLMAGKLKNDGNMYAGYDVYSPRSYGPGKFTGTALQNNKLYESQALLQGQSFKNRESAFYKQEGDHVTVNQNSRPMPGIKSIDVTFKGGVKSLREATISWICWDFGELDELMPHFLATGKTVLLEWGWVYGSKNTASIPKLIGANGKILSNAFEDYKDIIIGGQGDFDIMVGVVKNFEFTNRADGGFDCQTVLLSTGVSVLDNTMPNINTIDKTQSFDLNPKESEQEVQKKISKATKFFGGGGNKTGEVPEIITLNTNVTLKLFVDKIDDYILQELGGDTPTNKTSDNWDKLSNVTDTKNEVLRWKSNKFLALIKALGEGTVLNTWVKWGWFEDNVLNKFLGMTNRNGDAITTFKSTEKVLTQGGFSSGKEQSVRIRNHPDLETTDINNHILPGQFYAAPVDNDNDLDGDSKYIQALVKITTENFDPFASNAILRETIVTQDYADPMAYQAGGPIMSDEMIDSVDIGSGGQERLTVTEDSNAEQQANPKPGRFGFLRNMLINTKVIKQAFGSEGEFNAETINITEALESMFYLINQDLNFWSLQTSVDSENTSRVKIVDDSTTAIEFDKINRNLGMSSLATNTDDNSIIIGNEGIFYFPVWRVDSFVKSQNMTLKISNAQQMTAMYGANIDTTKEIQNPGSTQVDKGATLAGGFFNGSEDKSKQGIDIRFRNEIKDGDSDTVNKFIVDNVDELETAYEDKLKNLNEQIAASAKSEVEQKINFDSSVPPPLPRDLTSAEKTKILKFETDNENKFKSLFGFSRGDLTDLLNNKFDDKGRMKSGYIGMVSNLTTNHGTSKQSDATVLIPFDLDLDIDGTGGIYPGNSFHSTYVPSKYQKYSVFQAFDISHKVDSSGWTTTIGGKMRSTSNLIYETKSRDQKLQNSIENLLNRAKKEETDRVKERSKEIEKSKLIAEARKKSGTATGIF